MINKLFTSIIRVRNWMRQRQYRALVRKGILVQNGLDADGQPKYDITLKGYLYLETDGAIDL